MLAKQAITTCLIVVNLSLMLSQLSFILVRKTKINWLFLFTFLFALLEIKPTWTCVFWFGLWLYNKGKSLARQHEIARGRAVLWFVFHKQYNAIVAQEYSCGTDTIWPMITGRHELVRSVGQVYIVTLLFATPQQLGL